MIRPRLFLCSGVRLPANDPRRADRTVHELDALGSKANVTIQLEDVAKVFLKQLSPRLLDLLEIASYVYTADASTRRGKQWTDGASTEPWSRDLSLVIPVRDLGFWSRADVQDALLDLLGFLSEDQYSFEFTQLTHDRPTQQYLELGDAEHWPFQGVDRVLMFSGGLDSLAGATEMAARGESLVLVSHRPVSTIGSRQKALFEELERLYPSVKMLHVPVWINKSAKVSREYTQRTRSFLFASLGAIVADAVQAKGVRFFENGVVSLNLPVADEVLRARASRTTHPRSLKLMEDLLSLVLTRPLAIDNPFLHKTKSEVVEVTAASGAAALIGYTVSCAHTMFRAKTRAHCGTCSQCIDRRFATLAARQMHNDPEIDYEKNVLVSARADGYERNMAVNYARHAIELVSMSEDAIAAKFNADLARAVRHSPNKRELAQQLIRLHKRHGETVHQVLREQVAAHVAELIGGSLPDSSMLALVAARAHHVSTWQQFSDKIVYLLQAGLPVACKTHRPKDEKHAQEICDAILKGHESILVREFPFMQWSSVLTKPDWSVESLDLWVELKYVRNGNLRRVTEDMAADITKYGDNGRRVLFVVYDPDRQIVDEKEFGDPFRSRITMRACVVR